MSEAFTAVRSHVHVIGDDINTDYIIASRYKARADNLEGLAPHVFEDLDPGMAERIEQGDVIVAGENFGSGSSRETAPRVLLAAGIRAVVAKSFARIFFRNAINVGLPVIECDVPSVKTGDAITIHLAQGTIMREDDVQIATFPPLPPFLMEILTAGGIAKHLQANRGGSGEGQTPD